MHVQNKRLKFNILLTTYEILLKDKVDQYSKSFTHCGLLHKLPNGRLAIAAL